MPNFLSIQILQYDCRNRDMGGPTGCLQYFTATSGTIASFNYPIGASTIDAPTTFRRLKIRLWEKSFSK